MNYATLALNLFQSVLNEPWTVYIDNITIDSLQKAPQMRITLSPFKDEETLVKFAVQELQAATHVVRNTYDEYSLIRYESAYPSIVGSIKIVLVCTATVKNTQVVYPSFNAIHSR